MIDLTPLEVRKKKGDFRRVMRGYDAAPVDDFLDLVADRLDELVRENLTLTERVTRQEQQVSDYRERERALTEALVTAQEMREEIRRQTSQEADLLRRTVEQESSQLRSSAAQEAAQLRSAAQQEAAQLRAAAQQEASALKSRTEQELNELRSTLRQEREREEEALRALRARQEQFVTTYRSFLEGELNELGGISRALGLTSRGQAGAVMEAGDSAGSAGSGDGGSLAVGGGSVTTGGGSDAGGPPASAPGAPTAAAAAGTVAGLAGLASLTLTESRDPEAPADRAASGDDDDVQGDRMSLPQGTPRATSTESTGMFPDDDIFFDGPASGGELSSGSDLLAADEGSLYEDLDEPDPFEPEPFEPETFQDYDIIAGPFGLASEPAAGFDTGMLPDPHDDDQFLEPVGLGSAPADYAESVEPVDRQQADASGGLDAAEEEVNQLLRNAAAAGYSLDDIEEELLLDDDAVVEDEDDIDDEDGWLPTLLDDGR